MPIGRGTVPTLDTGSLEADQGPGRPRGEFQLLKRGVPKAICVWEVGEL